MSLPLSDLSCLAVIVSRLTLFTHTVAFYHRNLRDLSEKAMHHMHSLHLAKAQMNLPSISVPAELFRNLLSRANIDLSAPLPRKWARVVARVTEQVRLSYIEVMHHLHAEGVASCGSWQGLDHSMMSALPLPSVNIRTLVYVGQGFPKLKQMYGVPEYSWMSSAMSFLEASIFRDVFALRALNKVCEEIFCASKVPVLWSGEK